MSPPGNTANGTDLEEDRRDVGETNWTTTGRVATIWQRIANFVTIDLLIPSIPWMPLISSTPSFHSISTCIGSNIDATGTALFLIFNIT